VSDFVRKPDSEDEYFRRKERELLERLRAQAEAEAHRKGMADAVGIENEQILSVLRDLGFDRETVMLLFLIPLLQVAWSDGTLSPEERALVLEAARTHGVKEGHPAYAKLLGWVAVRPSKETFERALRVIGELMTFQTTEQRAATAEKLVDATTRVAAASGGFLGLGSKISADEKAVLKRVAAAIEAAHADSARKLLGDLQS
jgi:tellurite resistance protein